MVGVLRRIARSEFAGQNLVLAALLIAGLFLAVIVIITPLDLVSQALFGLLTITAMLPRRCSSPRRSRRFSGSA